MNDLMSPLEIERLAGEAGLSVRDLCQRAGIALSTFYRWRSGETEPTLGVYRRLRDALIEARAA